MGADLVATFLAIHKDKKPDFRRGRAEITRLRRSPIEKWPEDWVGDGNDPDPSTAAEQLKDDLKQFKEIWDGGSRETFYCIVSNHHVLFTGGMSWGDSPTELYDIICRLSQSGVAKALGFDS